MKKVEMLIPEYIKNFKCIGTKCEDSCCVGWKITIDEETYRKYKKLSDYEMRKKLEKHIGKNRLAKSKCEIAKIRLENKACPFLQDTKLCEIHSKLGEEYLSNTCAIYPRLNSRIQGVMEQGLTLSCPEAARLVLLNPTPIQFEKGEREFTKRNLSIKEISINKVPIKWKDYFWDFRIFTISLLQNREYTLEERIFILGLVYKNLEQQIQEGQIEEVTYLLKKYQINIDNKLYKNILDNIPNLVSMQVKLAKELVDIRYAMGIDSDEYIKCLSEMLMGLKFKSNVALDESVEAYGEGYTKYYQPFMEKYSYVLENYLVNYVFTKHMPIDKNSIFESYIQLVLHYVLIKIHLIGNANYHEEVAIMQVIKIIQVLSKTFEHTPYYFEQILNLIKENNYIELAHIAILIKS